MIVPCLQSVLRVLHSFAKMRLFALFASTLTAIHPDFQFVTCGSIIKLAHVQSGARLHSHEIPYGSGSGQQSVTGSPDINDPNSLFVVNGGYGKECTRGSKIECGSVITLLHHATKTRLHSHEFKSPLTKNQEVSASTANDPNDNFKLGCQSQFWKRNDPITLGN